MVKRRMIHSCIWNSDGLEKLTIRQRLLWVGLISIADDQGRGKSKPRIIKNTIFPYDDFSDSEIESDLTEIEGTGMILLYSEDDKWYFQIVKWWAYQKPQWAYPSEYPAPKRWEDQLRYRKDSKIHTVNWRGESIPKPLGKDLPKTDTQSFTQAHSTSTRNSLSIKKEHKDAKTAPINFSEWLQTLNNPQSIGEKNGLAVLLRMGQALYANFPAPSKNIYGRVGKLVKKAGTQASLAKVFWNYSSTPMAVPLDYLTKVVNNPGKYKTGEPLRPVTPVTVEDLYNDN